jgi:hypothetical protein
VTSARATIWQADAACTLVCIVLLYVVDQCDVCFDQNCKKAVRRRAPGAETMLPLALQHGATCTNDDVRDCFLAKLRRLNQASETLASGALTNLLYGRLRAAQTAQTAQ